MEKKKSERVAKYNQSLIYATWSVNKRTPYE